MSRSTKGILKKSQKKPPSVTSTASSSSWLSRIQSRLYSDPLDDPFAVPALQRQDLKRVTFSVGNLTTEYIFCNDPDENTQPQPQPATSIPHPPIASRELPRYYEKACRMREEPIMEHIFSALRTRCYSQLPIIDLSNRPITYRQAGPLSDVLLMDTELRSLNLSSCNLDSESIRILIHSLLLNDQVSELDLSSNAIKVDGFKYISIYISQSRAIKTLHLSHTSLDKRSLKYLSHALTLTPSLQHLSLDHCALKSPQVELLAGGVRQSPSLYGLSLKHNRISYQAAPWIAAMLINDDPIEMYWQSSDYIRRGLQRLDLTGNNLQYTMNSLAQALYGNRSLTELVLSNCQIYPNECAVLAEALLSNHHVQVLDLSCNPLSGGGSDEGIQAIKSMLAKNHFLRELNLAEAGLDSSEAIALAECLPENSTLTRLDLSRNPQITMAGVLALSISIKMNHTLTFLDINIPPNDVDLAQLQNEIVAICTRNMQRRCDDEATSTHDKYPPIKTTPSSSTLSTASSTTSFPPGSHAVVRMEQQLENQTMEKPSPRGSYASHHHQHEDTAISAYNLDEISLLDDITV